MTSVSAERAGVAAASASTIAASALQSERMGVRWSWSPVWRIPEA
jgi:hypothetical protein